MRTIICENYDEMAAEAAKIIAGQVYVKPDCILGLATGSTPIGIYSRLVKMNKSGEISFSEVKTFNLDEYYPLAASNEQSYHYFMNENLFNHIDIKKENIHIPSGEAEDVEKECRDYDSLIDKCGGIDLQLLGIGQNGHIGFNEPDENLICTTHVTDLTQNTIEANSRFFEKIEDVPVKAVTMGIATILKSKKIIIVANGKNKHKAVKAMLDGKINTNIPATMLNVHSDVVLICDREAYEG